MLRVAWLFVFACAALAQNPPEVRVSGGPYMPVTLRVESNVVQVGVVVRDAKGRAVPGLQREAFHVLDSGKEREITGFSVVTHASPAGGAPGTRPTAESEPGLESRRFIALFFDDITTASGDLLRVKRAATRFVEDGVSGGDRLSVLTASGSPLSDFTNDKTKLIAAISKIQAHPRYSESGLQPCPRVTPYDAYLIANEMGEHVLELASIEASQCGASDDAGTAKFNPATSRSRLTTGPSEMVKQIADMTWNIVRNTSQRTLATIDGTVQLLAKMPGSRMLLLASSGFIAGTMAAEYDAITDHALRAGVVINSLDAKGLFTEAPGREFGADPLPPQTPAIVSIWEDMRKVDSKEATSAVLGHLAYATGGQFFHNNNDFSFGFKELGSVPEVSYTLSFHPDEGALDGHFHPLKVRVDARGYHTIEARPGYFATAHDTSAPLDARAELDRHVGASTLAADFPVSAAIQYGAALAGRTPVHVQVHADLAALVFAERAGRRYQKLTFVAALVNDRGEMISAREGAMDFALGDAKFGELRKSGVNAVLNLDAPSGRYRLRVVAMEAGRKAGAADYAVVVP